VSIPGGAALRKAPSERPAFYPTGASRAAYRRRAEQSDPPRRAILIDLKDAPSPFQENTTRYPTAFPADVARRIVDNPRVVLWDVTLTPAQIAPMHFHRRYRGLDLHRPPARSGNRRSVAKGLEVIVCDVAERARPEAPFQGIFGGSCSR